MSQGMQRRRRQGLRRTRNNGWSTALLPLRRVVSIPVGLSSKELARRRSLANGSRSQPADTRPFNSPLATDGDTLGGAAVVATPSYEARIPSDVNVLRDEVQQLHEEISEPPPSYTSGAA
ncbi:hypothetical protein EDB89DRAFT_1900518 [Lactarius sanguifluus]|nr:hypothetical protein EDB89DRAFT_1900518 [Lactarius sanguifluus]